VLKVGLIGAGTMGRTHGSAYKQMPDVQLIGVCDVGPVEPKTFAEELQTRSFPSVEAMLDAGPQVVDICVPTPWHKECALAAAKAGCHVICEKPLARTLEDAREIITACETAGVKLFPAHVLRFFPQYATAKQLIDNGAIGKPAAVRTFRGDGFPQGFNDWYADFEKSGGLVLDMIIHDFDWLRWCFGPVERVFAKGLAARVHEHRDYALVTLRMRSGPIAHVEGTWTHPGGFEAKLEVVGDAGMIEFAGSATDPVHLRLRTEAGGPGGVPVPESPLEVDPYFAELRHFLDCLQSGAEPIVTPEDGYRALEISLAALESIQTGRVVTLSE
jgi:UDP-N-acetylglucosamine 3-dehydrogenase